MPGRRPRAEFPGRQGERIAERVRRNQSERISELQKSPGFNVKVIRDVFLPNGTVVPIPHGMGRPVSALFSAPRRNGSGFTAGRILRVDGSTDAPANGTPDPSQYVTVVSDGWGGTGITVDVWVI